MNWFDRLVMWPSRNNALNGAIAGIIISAIFWGIVALVVYL